MMTRASIQDGHRPQPIGDAEPTPILHVDMDSFFAAVEVADEPSLVGRPVVVGGTGERGVVASASYEARAFGVRSAMPTLQARSLCPDAVFLAGRFSRYAEVSAILDAIFGRFTPLVEKISLDEAFLDVSGSRRRSGDALTIASEIRKVIESELSMTASVGIARCKFLAKLASREAKPSFTGTHWPRRLLEGRGIVVVDPSAELAFLHPMPVRNLWGVGPATAKRLARLGVETIGDITRVPEESLARLLGSAAAHQLHNLALARDDRPIVVSQESKSIGNEETFATDIRSRSSLEAELARLADGVAHRLAVQSLGGRRVTLKIKSAEFDTVTRSRTLGEALVSASEIFAVVKELSETMSIGSGVRLAGVALSLLEPARRGSQQLQLDLDGSAQRESGPSVPRRSGESVWEAVTAIRHRFGQASVGTARLLAASGLRVKSRGDTQWGPPANS